MTLQIALERDEDGAFIALVLNLPGCIVEGHTREEALANAEAARLYLAPPDARAIREAGEIVEIPV